MNRFVAYSSIKPIGVCPLVGSFAFTVLDRQFVVDEPPHVFGEFTVDEHDILHFIEFHQRAIDLHRGHRGRTAPGASPFQRDTDDAIICAHHVHHSVMRVENRLHRPNRVENRLPVDFAHALPRAAVPLVRFQPSLNISRTTASHAR